MSLLWVQAMPWQVHHGEEDMAQHAVHVKDAGFAGFVSHRHYDKVMGDHKAPFNHKVWNDVEPEPSDEDFHHFDQHGEFSPDHAKRHQQAYDEHMAKDKARDKPDHIDNHVVAFAHGDSRFASTWQNKGTLGSVDLKSQPVYATQSHVNQAHINRYKHKPQDTSWHQQTTGIESDEYEGSKHPLFVTHEGRLHVIEGHHRVAAALQRGDSHIHGWHYDLDKHPLNG